MPVNIIKFSIVPVVVLQNNIIFILHYFSVGISTNFFNTIHRIVTQFNLHKYFCTLKKGVIALQYYYLILALL